MTSTLEDNTLTRDAFLGGRLSVWQPKDGYRAGMDPVLLAAEVSAVPGQSVLELGCGVGVASLCLQRRVGSLAAEGLEIQPEYAELARRNATDNDLPLQVFTGDISDMPPDLRAKSFDHVIANPPYFDRRAGPIAGDAGRETSRGEVAPLAVWIEAGVRRLVPGGILTVIQKADRLADLLRACDTRLGGLCVLPLAPRTGRNAELVILSARKGARGAFRLLAPKILHRGERHQSDGENFTDELRAVLRDCAPLRIG